MIEKKIRSPHQLYEIVGEGKIKNVIYGYRSHIGIGSVVRTEGKSLAGKKLLFYNDVHDAGLPPMETLSGESETFFHNIEQIGRTQRQVLLYSDDSRAFRMFDFVWLLPDTFIKDYENFCTEHKKYIYDVLSKRGYDVSHPYLKLIFALTGPSRYLYTWLAKLMMEHKATITEIIMVMQWANKYSQLMPKLKKSTLTAYTKRSDIILLKDELQVLRREKRINDVISTFNTQQKKALKSLDKSAFDKSTVEAFSKFAKLSTTKRMNFIKKMSSVEDTNEIIRAMKMLTDVLFEWTKESFMDFIKNAANVKCDIVLDKDNIVIVKSNDFETIKHIAKNTNWCISKNKTYWDNYLKGSERKDQYVMFNFASKEDALDSIVGFTSVMDKGIIHAHDFVNNNLISEDYDEEYMSGLVSHRFTGQTSNNIFSLLRKHDIDPNTFSFFSEYPFAWNKESFLDFISKTVGAKNMNIILDKDNFICLIVQSPKMMSIVGRKYQDEVPVELWGNKHVFFLNFNLPYNSTEAFLYAPIAMDYESMEEYPEVLLSPRHNSVHTSFDRILSERNLPYNIISRINDQEVIFKKKFLSFNLLSAPEVENPKKVINDMLKTDRDKASSVIQSSVMEYYSMTYLEYIYNNGLTVFDIMGEADFTFFIGQILSLYYRCSGGVCDYKNPSERDIDDFFNKRITGASLHIKVMMFLALSMIIVNEKNVMALRVIASKLRTLRNINIDKSTHIGEMIFNALITLLEANNVKHYDINDDFFSVVHYRKIESIIQEKVKSELLSKKNIISTKYQFTFSS